MATANFHTIIWTYQQTVRLIQLSDSPPDTVIRQSASYSYLPEEKAA